MRIGRFFPSNLGFSGSMFVEDGQFPQWNFWWYLKTIHQVFPRIWEYEYDMIYSITCAMVFFLNTWFIDFFSDTGHVHHVHFPLLNRGWWLDALIGKSESFWDDPPHWKKMLVVYGCIMLYTHSISHCWWTPDIHSIEFHWIHEPYTVTICNLTMIHRFSLLWKIGHQEKSHGFHRISMDWFKGKFTGKPHIKDGKIYGFRLRFSLTNQSISSKLVFKNLWFPVDFPLNQFPFFCSPKFSWPAKPLIHPASPGQGIGASSITCSILLMLGTSWHGNLWKNRGNPWEPNEINPFLSFLSREPNQIHFSCFPFFLPKGVNIFVLATCFVEITRCR